MRIAVVGSGVSGLAAAWALNEHSEHEVHLYESNSRPGGHANTVEFPRTIRNSEACYVDTGFITFNRVTYPNFSRFLNLFPSLRVIQTAMSLSVSRDHGAFEWSGKSLWSVLCQKKRLLDPGMWKMVYDILRFNATSRNLLTENEGHNLSIAAYLDREEYSIEFRDNYLLPMTAGIWSMPPDLFAINIPARTLIQYMHNHQLLRVFSQIEWLTIAGGSREYVNRIVSAIPQRQLHLSTRVKSVTSAAETDSDSTHPFVILETEDGAIEKYDHVIITCHSDAALKILKAGGSNSKRAGGITEEEEKILGMFQWVSNECVLHSDERLMPRNKEAWSSWNYITESSTYRGEKKLNSELLSITFGMNELQDLPYEKHGPVLVTLNPLYEPRAETIIGRWKFDHPLLDNQAKRAQKLLKLIQGTRSISYAGAYTKYGFHEDGFTSGIEAAEVAIASSGSPLKLPFELIRDIDEVLNDTEGIPAGLTSALFGFFEMSGLRIALGTVLGPCLVSIRWILGFFLDVSL